MNVVIIQIWMFDVVIVWLRCLNLIWLLAYIKMNDTNSFWQNVFSFILENSIQMIRKVKKKFDNDYNLVDTPIHSSINLYIKWTRKVGQFDYPANSGTEFVNVGVSNSSLLLLFWVHICCILYIWMMSWSAGQLYK